MKNGMMILAAAGALMLGGNAMADGHVVDLGDNVLGGGESVAGATTLGAGVTGFTVEFDYSEDVSDASWASDVQVIVTAPSGAVWTVGGFTNAGDADVLWSFDGSDSDGPGHYGDLDPQDPWAGTPEGPGEFTVTFVNDWEGDGNPNNYNNVTVTFHQIPAPAGLALLGVAGLTSRRRRRG